MEYSDKLPSPGRRIVESRRSFVTVQIRVAAQTRDLTLDLSYVVVF